MPNLCRNNQRLIRENKCWNDFWLSAVFERWEDSVAGSYLHRLHTIYQITSSFLFFFFGLHPARTLRQFHSLASSSVPHTRLLLCPADQFDTESIRGGSVWAWQLMNGISYRSPAAAGRGQTSQWCHILAPPRLTVNVLGVSRYHCWYQKAWDQLGD